MNRCWMLVLALSAGLTTQVTHARERMVQALPDGGHSREVLAPPAQAHAALSQWTYLGPERADVAQFAVSPVDPDRMLAVNSEASGLPVDGRVMQTFSAGQEWGSLHQFRNSQVTIAFTSDGFGLAATDAGLYYSLDAWGWMQQPDPNIWDRFYATHLSVAPFADAPVWMTGVSGGVFRVYRVAALVDDWVDVTPTLPSGAQVQGLAASETTPGQAVLAWYSPSEGVMRTMYTLDDGDSWTTSAAAAGGMATVTALRMVDDRILLGTGSYGGFNGLVAGEAFGDTWQELYSGGTDAAVRDLAVDIEAPATLWIATRTGVKRSDDGGQTWQAGAPEVMNLPASMVRHDAASGRLWVGVQDSGVWLSDDGGATFEPRSFGLNRLPASAIVIDENDFTRVGLLHPGGLSPSASVSLSSDGGLTWEWEHGPPSHTATRLRFDPDGTAYVAGAYDNPGLYRRSPGGTWQSIGPSNVDSVLDFAFGETPGTLVVSEWAFNWETYLYDVRLHRYDALDGTWDVVFQGMTDSQGFIRIERVPTASGGVRLLARESGLPGVLNTRLLASDDDGRSWYPLEPVGGNWSGGEMCVGSDGVVVMLVTVLQTRLYRSADAGLTWQQTAWQPTPGQSQFGPMAAIHCSGDAREVYLGDRNGNVWASDDGGDSFPHVVGDASVWDQRQINDIGRSRLGLYVAHGSGTWVNTALAGQPEEPTDLSVTVVSARMRTLATLQWVGGASQVEIRRNAAVVATVPNEGRYVDGQLTPLRTPDTTWQVCNAGTSQCSDIVGP